MKLKLVSVFLVLVLYFPPSHGITCYSCDQQNIVNGTCAEGEKTKWCNQDSWCVKTWRNDVGKKFFILVFFFECLALNLNLKFNQASINNLKFLNEFEVLAGPVHMMAQLMIMKDAQQKQGRKGIFIPI